MNCSHGWQKALVVHLDSRFWRCPSCLLAKQQDEKSLLFARARAMMCVPVGERQAIMALIGLEEQIEACAVSVESRLGSDPRKER